MPTPIPDDVAACTIPDTCTYKFSCRRAVGHRISDTPKPFTDFPGGDDCHGRMFDARKKLNPVPKGTMK